MNPVTPSLHNTLPGPDDTTRVELPNGITVITRPNFNSPSVVLSGYLCGGSHLDPNDRLGLAHFTALALMRGTQRHDFQQIFDALESSGASLGFGASVHNTSFGGRALSEDLPLLLQFLAECLREPVFPVEQVERLRAQLLTGLAIRAQDTADMASLSFDEIVFKGHPYGRPEDGYPETVQPITASDLADFHARRYRPRGMVVVVVGAVEPLQAVDEVQRALGGWADESADLPVSLPPVAPLASTERRHIPIAGKTQTDLVMGGLAPRRGSSDYMPASLGNNILGQFGMMGRIGEIVREQSGLAYHASTSLNSWISAGSWEVSAGVNPANLERAVELIIRELRRFVTEPVTPEELADSQANFVGRLPLSLESNGGVANALLNIERFQLGMDYFRRYAGLVQSVTPQTILEVASRYLHPDALAVVSAGPAV